MNPNPNPGLYRFDPSIPRSQVLAELAAMPGRLRRAVTGATAEALLRRRSNDGWCAFETLCHFRDATLAYAARFRWIVFNNDPFLPDYDENNCSSAEGYSEDVPHLTRSQPPARISYECLRGCRKKHGSAPAVTR
jgi:hypothetical protein